MKPELSESIRIQAQRRERWDYLLVLAFPGQGEGGFITRTASPLSSQSMLLAQTGGRGENRGWGEVPEAQTLLASPFSLFPSLPSRSWLALGKTEAQGQLEGGGWDRASRGTALGPRPGWGVGPSPPPYSSSLSSQHSKYL